VNLKDTSVIVARTFGVSAAPRLAPLLTLDAAGQTVEDWPIVAVALMLKIPVWTEDRGFFGSGIATWTTDRVELYLQGRHG
jgi:predicted nucleic acid-binding protein